MELQEYKTIIMIGNKSHKIYRKKRKDMNRKENSELWANPASFSIRPIDHPSPPPAAGGAGMLRASPPCQIWAQCWRVSTLMVVRRRAVGDRVWRAQPAGARWEWRSPEGTSTPLSVHPMGEQTDIFCPTAGGGSPPVQAVRSRLSNWACPRPSASLPPVSICVIRDVHYCPVIFFS
jgi:hypothetical protein